MDERQSEREERQLTGKTTHDPDGAFPTDLEAARAAAWEEHGRRCATNEPYADGVTTEVLAERVEGLRLSALSAPAASQDYALAVTSGEGPPADAINVGDPGSDVEGVLSWVAVLPECDRRLFAEELSRLLAEAAHADDLAAVEQALREWRVTAEIHADPVLAQRLSGPLVANGGRVPRPAV